VGQHDASAANADAAGGGSDGGDEDFWRRAGDGCRVVVLGAPVAMVAQGLGVLGKRERFADGGVGGAAADNGGLVEDGETHGDPLLETHMPEYGIEGEIDQPADQEADQRAVDADILQVGAEA
jgi:hypothetical protein